MRKKLCLLLMYICSFLFSVTPLAVYIILNSHRYISAREDAVKLTLGGIICVSVVLFKILGRIKAPSSTVCLGILFLLSYLLKSVTDDLLALSFLALAGDLADKIFLSIPIKRLKRSMDAELTADATAVKLEQIFEKYYRGGEHEAGL